ncbi:MAG: pyrroline-5-carboxylate reductase [Betaproteobacteria bacterium]
MNLTFIGGGNMAGAIIGGLVNGGANPREFRVVDPLPAQQDKLVGLYPGIGIFGEASVGAVEGADIVVLAVKPQQMRAAARALAPWLPDVPVIMSIAAGVRLADISRWLDGNPRLVRAMPNTPALIGEGISGMFALPEAGARGRKFAQRVLEGVGKVLWVIKEDMLDAVTGVSGSGPAYVFYFLESLEQAAQELGFSKEDARTLAYATFSGTVKLAASSDLEPGILRAQVTSKNGTTERAIAVLETNAVKKHFMAAVKAATARAKEMGDALSAEG